MYEIVYLFKTIQFFLSLIKCFIQLCTDIQKDYNVTQ